MLRDDRYAKFFLFTEEEVEMLCSVHGQFDIAMLRAHYNGYVVNGRSGPVKLFNPLSVTMALEKNEISEFWVETDTVFRRTAWPRLRAYRSICTSVAKFRRQLDLLLMRQSVELVVDDAINFLTYDSISDAGLWGPLYYAGYLTA